MIKELNYDLIKDDLCNFQLDCTAIRYKKYGFIFISLISLISILSFVGYIYYKNYICLFFFFLFFILEIIYSIVNRNIYNFPKIQNNGCVENINILIDINNNFIRKNSIDYKWNKIQIYNENRNILLFTSLNNHVIGMFSIFSYFCGPTIPFLNSNIAIIIPKRIFSSEEEMNETWNLIQECFNKSR